MRKVFFTTALVGMAALLSASVFAQDETKDFSARGAQIYQAKNGRSLTLPSNATSAQVTDGFLRSLGHSSSTLASLSIKGENSSLRTGFTHLRFEQEVDGLKVYGAYVKASGNHRGELVSLIENLASTTRVTPSKIDAEAALRLVLRKYYPGHTGNLRAVERAGNKTIFSKGDIFAEDLTATRVAVPTEKGTLNAGYLVVTWDRDNILRHTVVSGNGRILVEELRTNSDSYNVFTNNPDVTGQSIVSGPGAGNAYSPLGWVSSNTTIGNNVDAYLDRNNDNSPDSGGRPISSTKDFLTAANLSQDPTTNQNQMVAVQNLFYLNNFIHDKLYQHGFNEAAGNFQSNNFGNGGAGNDPVNAEAQDGGGTNNANFATPSDGSRPRMQMYVWTQTTPRRDGDLDSDIVYHEYGHGLTWRMIGGMSGPMSGAIGEGMGDVLAILINNDDTVGEYSLNNSLGIRSARYTNYPRTYGDFSGTGVHFNGEIYAATIWRLKELFDQNALSRDTLFDYLIGGMNFTPSGPAMEDMRDGILTAANGSGNECIIWDAFAQFGIGAGAKASVKGGGPTGGRVTVNESFNVPASCDGGGGGGGGGDIVLSASLSTRGQTRANLEWTGGGSTNVDIRRNGSLIATIANEGSYSDSLKRVGSGSLTYQVCEAGSSTACSNEVTVNNP
jgi:hypothetical protein